MSKTSIERLRNLYREWIDEDRVPSLEDRVSEIADRIERDRAEELAALEPRLMPEGMEWLRYNDGEKVLPTDEGIIGIEHSKTGNTVLITATDDEPRVVFAPGERVKRPEPEVLAADGLPLEVGDAVWFVDCESCVDFVSENLSFRDEMRVVEINRGSKRPVVVQHAHGSAVGFCKPNSITHAPPDTQERIDSDAWKDATAYCQEYGVPVGYPKHAGKMKCEHLLRRQRELDKREMGGK